MADLNTQTCDMCPEVKKEVNHWFMGFVVKDGSVVIKPWNEATITTYKLIGEQCYHLCGLDCASKWLMKQLAKPKQSSNLPAEGGPQ